MLKKFFFILIALFVFTLIFEVIFSIFFYYKTGYSGPIFRLFLKETKTQEAIIGETIKLDTSTNKMVPGKYLVKGIEYNINSYGFRGKEFLIKNKHNCRVISLGGSITLGQEKSYPFLLENMLLKKNKNCESLNFGMASKGLNYIEELFFNEVLSYDPNFITIMANRNSTMYDSYGSGSKSPGIIKSRFDYSIYRVNKFLFSNFMIFRFLDLSMKRVVFILSEDNSKIVNPKDESLLHSINYFDNKYFNQLSNIAKACEKNKIKLILIKEPYFLDINFQKKIKNLSREKLLEKLIKYKEEDYENKNVLFWSYTNALLNNIFDDIQKNFQNVIVVDPTDILYSQSKEKNFLNDGNHLKDNGHIIVAEEIFKKIKQYF